MRLASLALLVLAASAQAVSTGATGAFAACGSDWTIVPTPKVLLTGHATGLGDVVALSASDAWAVGRLAQGSRRVTFAQHWDGSQWTVAPTPNVGKGDNGLNAVDAAAPDDVWAVGYIIQKEDQAGGTYAALTEHWGGGSWNVVQTPATGTQDSALSGVAAISPSDVWSVGLAMGTITTPFVQHWNGTAWSPSSPVVVGDGDSALLGVDGLSAGDVWAVGYQTGSLGAQPLVEHWNGSVWSVMPTGFNMSAVLTGVVEVTPGDLWVVGYTISGGSHQTLTMHWNGSAWTVTPSPNPGLEAGLLRAVTAAGADRVWAAGAYYSPQAGAFRTLVVRWDGAAWTLEPSPNHGGGSTNQLSGIGVSPDSSRLWASGSTGQQMLLETSCPLAAAHATRPGTASTGGPAAASAGGTLPRSGPVRSGKALIASGAPPAPRSGRPAGVALDPPRPLAGAVSVIAKDKAADAGISELTTTWNAVIADVNSDGRPDIFLGRHAKVARLYLNDGQKHFTEPAPGSFGKFDRHGCDIADVNGDGRPDVFCASGVDHGTSVKTNDLRLQQPDGTFQPVATSYGVMDPIARGRQVTFIDANHDGRPDLFVGNERARPDGLPSYNRLFINQSGTSFRDALEMGVDRELGADCAQANDYNGDGWQDLLVCGNSEQGLRLYLNAGGVRFVDVTANVGLDGQLPRHARLVDLNGDGFSDMVLVFADHLTVLLQQAGSFTPVYTRALAAGAWVAAGDVNADGRPDLYVVQGASKTSDNEPDVMLLNNGLGTGFTEMSVPETAGGSGDSAYPIDYDGNGLTDFLVLNGAQLRSGPIQLISFLPA